MGKDCVFPFKYNDEEYNECTWEEAPTGEAWCSTLVDEAGNHVENKKKWAVCGPGCPIESELMINN